MSRTQATGITGISQTFSPKAIAGIGRLPQTIEDRSIPIELKRKRRQEERERFRIRRVRLQAKPLYERLARWAKQNLGSLRYAEPSLPQELNDRQQDVCEPLLAIADRVGGEWPARARHALIQLSTSRPAQDDSPSLRLLADIRAAFQRRAEDRLSTRQLLKELTGDETGPWAEWKGKPLSATQLATMLRPLAIFPSDIRFGSQSLKGYHRADFADSWERYLSASATPPAPEGQQGRQSAIYAGSGHFSEARQQPPVAGEENANPPAFTQVVADVALPSQSRQGADNGKARVRFCWEHPFDASWRQAPDGTWVCGRC